jgi:hypothetical protein
VSLWRHVPLFVAVDAVAGKELMGPYRLLAVRNGPVAVAAGADLLILVNAPQDPLVRRVDVVFRYLCPQVVVTWQTVSVCLLVRARVCHQVLMGSIDVLRRADAVMTGHTPQSVV